MDSQAFKNSFDTALHSPKYARARIVLLSVIGAALLVVLGWFIYTRFIHPPLTAAQKKALVIQEVKDNSPLVPQSVKAPVLEKLAAENAPKKVHGTVVPQYTEAQKAAVLQSSFFK